MSKTKPKLEPLYQKVRRKKYTTRFKLMIPFEDAIRILVGRSR